MPLANGSATHVTARAAAVAGGAGWKCCGKSFRYTGLKVDETMGDLGLVPTPPPEVLLRALQTLLHEASFETASTTSHCTERAVRATERKDFLSH